MKRVLYILVCLSLASTATALSITNGDFENQTGDDIANVADWYDYQDNDTNYWDGPWFRGSGEDTINETGCLLLGNSANTDEDGGNKAYVYQSLGTYDDIPMLEIALQWGADGAGLGGEMGLTVMVLESDGTFVPGEPFVANEIYGASGITEIARASVTRDTDPGVAIDEVFLLDISSATVGKELFLRINNFAVDIGTRPVMSVDNITLRSLSVINQSPEDNAAFIAVELGSPENDLVFDVIDNHVTKVDVLFGTDPNLSDTIESFTGVTPGQYTVDLEGGLPANLLEDGHLLWEKDYYWQVLAYEPNGVDENDVSLRNEGEIRSFTTVLDGPYLGAATPNPNGVYAGSDAEFTVFSSKADTFEWWKSGDPNVLLDDENDPKYSGITTDTLTIHDVQPEDEGFYYCVGTESSSGKTSTSESGELYIKGLKHYFPFNYDDVAGDITLDVIGGVQAQLMGGASVVEFSEATYSEPNSVIGDYLQLDNPGESTEDTQYAQILDPSVFDYAEITVSAWYRMASQDGKAIIWACGEDGDNYWDFSPYTEYGSGQVARNEFKVGSDQTRLDVIYEANADEWYFVTMTMSGRTVKMYIDGEYMGTGKTYDGMLDLPKTLAYIGKRVHETTGNYPKFNGSIDELKIYNYAMSTVEVGHAYLEVMAGVESVCNQEIYDLGAYDYDGNCRVDLLDFAEMAAHWLDDYRISLD